MQKYKMAERIIGENQDSWLLEQLLRNRNIIGETEIKSFLEPNYDEHRHDPFLLSGMSEAVERIKLAIEQNEKIAIYSDYDCDGIPGAVVLHDFFKAIGFLNFTNYIPHRHYEGFGLNKEAIKKLKADGVKLIVTIDCGTGDLEAVKFANENDIDVIVTDHHEPKATLPEAVAVVNPKIGDSYPFKDLCGAGVVFKLVEALIEKGGYSLGIGQEKWWLDMVGLATINDMVPLVGENRVLARYGLQVLRKSRRPGLQHLLRNARVSQRFLSEDDVGFTIGPRINAASRMDTPEDAFVMLSSVDEVEAGKRVEHLEHLNNERKGVVASMTKELKHRMSEMIAIPAVVFLGNPAWRPALVGLSANSIANEYKRPTFLWGKDGNGLIKGSCRSDGRVSVVKLMEAVKDAFSEYGGHHYSGGFTLNEGAIFSLPERLNQVFIENQKDLEPDEELLIDAELSLDDIDRGLLKTLLRLSPYGHGNPKPLFAFKNVKPIGVVMFGKQKEHLKLMFENSYKRLEAISFYTTPEDFKIKPEVGVAINLLAHVEETFFLNRMQTRLRIVDVLAKV